jgi:hypothetical protein
MSDREHPLAQQYREDAAGFAKQGNQTAAAASRARADRVDARQEAKAAEQTKNS